MPSLTLTSTAAGPLIQVVLGLSKPHADAVLSSGKTIPPPVQGTFLIDTGASGTVCDPGLLKSLMLTPTGAVMAQTPSTNGVAVACSQYDVSLYIPPSNPGVAGHYVEAMPIVEASLRPQGIDGLLGRDVLTRCVLIYNGQNGVFILSY